MPVVIAKMNHKPRENVVLSKGKRRKNKKPKRNARNGMQKKAAMDSLAKSMNKGFGYGAK